MGRLTLYTQDRIDRFLTAIKTGATYQIAADFAGFSYRRYREWMVDAEENPESPFKDLPDLVRQAEAEGAVARLARIDKASRNDWKAAAWLLERRHPEDYGRRTHTDARVEHSGALSIETVERALDERLEALTDEQLKALI